MERRFEVPTPLDKLDPYETPAIPFRGFASAMHFAFSYTNAERYLRSVGPERGMSFSAQLDVTHPAMGSDFTAKDVRTWSGTLTALVLLSALPVPLNANGTLHQRVATAVPSAARPQAPSPCKEWIGTQ